MSEKKKSQTKKEVIVSTKKEDTKIQDIELSIHEIEIQLEDLKLAVTSLTKGLKGVYSEIDSNSNRLNKVADRLGL